MPLEILNTLGTSGRITCWEQNYRSTYYVFLKSSMFGVTVRINFRKDENTNWHGIGYMDSDFKLVQRNINNL